jgi:hypothetical protein
VPRRKFVAIVGAAGLVAGLGLAAEPAGAVPEPDPDSGCFFVIHPDGTTGTSFEADVQVNPDAGRGKTLVSASGPVFIDNANTGPGDIGTLPLGTASIELKGAKPSELHRRHGKTTLTSTTQGLKLHRKTLLRAGSSQVEVAPIFIDEETTSYAFFAVSITAIGPTVMMGSDDREVCDVVIGQALCELEALPPCTEV